MFGSCALSTTTSTLRRSSEGCSSAPAVPWTQCTGQMPGGSMPSHLPGSTSTPTNEPWSGGCQSRVATTKSKRSAIALIGPAISSPLLDRQRAAGREVVLEVDDQEGVHRASYIRSAMSPDRTTTRRPRRAAARARRRRSQLKAPGGVAAAVLIPLYVDRRRAARGLHEAEPDLRRHAGEISFPGGRRDEGEELRDDGAARGARRRSGSRRTRSRSSARCRRPARSSPTT